VSVVVLGLYLLVFGQGTCPTIPSNASENCNSGSKTCVAAGWGSNTKLPVYIDTTGFSQDAITAIRNAFTNWQSGESAYWASVIFTEVNGTPNLSGNYFIVQQGKT
jgi:hypothetical protein